MGETNLLDEKVKSAIRDVADFPKTGILFKDITPVLLQPALVSEMVVTMANQLQNIKIDAIAGIESRGYLFGLLLAQKLNVPFVMIRKAGKLPAKTIQTSYELEYGTASIEVHEDAIVENSHVLIHDDLLATGGTAIAASKLISQKAHIAGFSFVMDLSFLNGKATLEQVHPIVKTLITY